MSEHEVEEHAGPGTFVLDRAGALIAVDGDASELLRCGHMLLDSEGRLVGTTHQATRELRALAASALARGARTEAIVLPGSSGSEVVVSATPLRPAPPVSETSPAALLLTALLRTASKSGEELQARFGLTPSEVEVALMLGNGCSPKEIARARDKSVHTVRAQIRSIHGKTGAHNQLELARLLNGGIPKIGYASQPRRG